MNDEQSMTTGRLKGNLRLLNQYWTRVKELGVHKVPALVENCLDKIHELEAEGFEVVLADGKYSITVKEGE